MNDPWSEFDTGYMLTCHTIIALTFEGELKELRVDDVKMEGIRDHLEGLISSKIGHWWAYEGNGHWKRTQATVPPSIEALPYYRP